MGAEDESKIDETTESIMSALRSLRRYRPEFRILWTGWKLHHENPQLNGGMGQLVLNSSPPLIVQLPSLTAHFGAPPDTLASLSGKETEEERLAILRLGLHLMVDTIVDRFAELFPEAAPLATGPLVHAISSDDLESSGN